MNRLLAALFGLRFGERRMALMMTAYHVLLLVTLYLLKPVRDSLFLSERGALELPFVFMLTTVAVIPVAALHVRAGRRLRLSRLVNGVAVILVLNLLGLRWLVRLDEAWVYYTLYAWVSVFAILVTSQFWLLANAVFTAAESKRVFPLLSAGAILGSVVGGEVTGLLVDRWGMRTENLLLVAAGVLAASSLIVVWVRRKSEDREDRDPVSEAPDGTPANILGVFKTLRGSRHLQLIVGVIALAVITTTFVDYQFKTVAASAFPTEGALTTFMGRFYGRVSLIAFLLQLFLAPRLIRMLGVGGALSLLPLTLALGSGGLLVFGGLWAGTVLRGIDQSLKHSIDKTGRELLFVPIELEKKKRVKVFIDLFFDQGMQGVGGLLLLLFTLGLGLSVEGLSVVVLGLLAAWLGFVLLARSSYINQYRDLLRQPEEQGKDDGTEQDTRPMSLEEGARSLGSRSADEVVRGLKRLEDACDPPGAALPDALPVEALGELLEHRAPEVRRRVLRILRKGQVEGQAEAVAVHLEDPDAGVRLEAARYLYRSFDSGRKLFLRQGLEHDDLRIRAAAVGLVAKDGGPEERALLTDALLKDLVARSGGEDAEEARLQAARALSVVEWPGRDALLIDLMDDPSPEVAGRAVKSAGQTGDRAFVAPLLEQLQEEEREEDEARRSLAAFGERIMGTLYDHLADPQTPERLRRRIPSVLCAARTQAAVDVLLISRGRVPVPVWHEVVHALSHLRKHGNAADDDPLRFPEEAVLDALGEEASRFAMLGKIVFAHDRATDSSAQVVGGEALHEARRRSLERLCRLLGLRYRQDDLYNAYRGLTSDEAAMRSSAAEFLDNVFERDLERDLLPLLDDPDGRRAATEEADRFGTAAIEDWPAALRYLIAESRDPALATRAIEAAAQTAADVADAVALHEPLKAARRDPSAAVRTAAREALGEPSDGDSYAGGPGTATPREDNPAPERPVSLLS